MTMHTFYEETISYVNELKKSALQEDFFNTFKNLLSKHSEVNPEEFNKAEKIDYFTSVVSLYTSYEILFLTKIELNILETNPESIINYINKNEYVKLGFDKGKECNETEKDFDEIFGGLQIPFINKNISYAKIYNTIKNENLDDQYYEKSFKLVQDAALSIQNEMKTLSFDKELKTDSDLDSFIEFLYNCHELPKNFCKEILPIRHFIKLFQSEDIFYSKISNTLLNRKLETMNIKSPVKAELSYENCLLYLRLLNNYGFISSAILSGLFSIVLNENSLEKSNTEMIFRYVKVLLQIIPDFLLKYPGFAFYLYDVSKEFDFNTLARAFDCSDNMYYEEVDIYEKVCNYTGHKISPVQSIINSEFFKNDDFNYEKNVNQNLLCVLIYIGLLDFLSSDTEKYSEAIELIMDAVKQKKINQFSGLLPILNKLAEQMNLTKSKPFCELKFDENDTSDFNAKNIAVNILYMLSHVNSLDAIYHEINFVREQQRAVLDCVPNKKFRYDEEDVDDVIEVLKKNKETLKEIDSGFSLDFFQEHEFSKMAGTKKGVTRKITCKLFSESDKKFDNIHKYRSRGKYKIDYEENYRVSYRNRFSNYYLYMDRNRYTHYSNDLVIEKLLDDSLSLNSLFQAVDEVLNFLGKLMKSEKNVDEKVIYAFFAALMSNSLYKLLCKFVPEKEVPPEKVQELIDAIFDSKLDPDTGTYIAVLKKKYRQSASEFSIEQNVSKKDLDFLRKSFEFAFIVDNDFLSICKDQVIIYLMYMSIKLSTFKV